MAAMLRRDFLAGIAAAPLFAQNGNSPVRRIDRNRLSAITDEIAFNREEAMAFTRHYKLHCIELRDVPGAKRHYESLSEQELKEAAKEFQENGVKVTFFNTPYFKFPLPGTEPVRRRTETPEAREKRLARDKAFFETRAEDVRRGARAAQMLGADKMRVFTFSRVAEPESVMQRVAEILGEMALVAGKEGVKMLIENEASCNVATSAELAGIMKLIPSKNVGMNWDSENGMAFKETVFPDGYNTLPKDRLWNVQAKGHTLLDPAHKLDWAAIFSALERDGYSGAVGLETHYFDGTNLEKSHMAMEEMIRIAESSRT